MFSLVIYTTATHEIERGFRSFEVRMRRGDREFIIPHGSRPIFAQDLDDVNQRGLRGLIIANGIIFVTSFVAGYVLAGKTLKPIEEVLNEQKRFVADASHELKTPLTALKTSIEVTLRDKKLNLNDAKHALKESLDDVDNLKRLSNDLLSLSSLQEGSNGFVKEKVNIKQIISESLKKITPMAKAKKINITKAIEDVELTADKKSLEKLMTVMLDNAVKHTATGGKVVVSTKRARNSVVIKVQDNGIGISKSDHSRIFERFYQVDESRSKTKTPGFGLGLSIAKRIVIAHKGTISVKSELKKGSTFTVKLPL